MTSNLRIVRSLCSALAFAGLAALLIVIATSTTTTAMQASPPQSPNASGEIRFTAASVNVSQPGEAVKINLIRWSTEEEKAAVVASLTPPPPRGEGRGGGAGRGGDGAARGGGNAPDGNAGRGGRGAPPAAPFNPVASLGAAITKSPTVGYLWTAEITGYPIKYAFRAAQPDGTERVVLAVDRRIGAFTPAWKPTAAGPDYPFTIIEIKLDAKGLGEAKTTLNTKYVLDAEAKTIAVENYAATPATLRNVKR